MSPETLTAIAKMKPTKFVWCQHGKAPGAPMDEHQVCLDQESAHYARGYSTWGCTCNCHR